MLSDFGDRGEFLTEAASGDQMYGWMRAMWDFPRSITGQGLRDTLHFIGERVPGLRLHSVPSGTRVGDWIVPPEWNISEAYLENAEGQRIVDFADCNLHVVGYSTPVDEWLTREQLEPHLHSISEVPEAIPYVTSYYEPRWGFCLSAMQRAGLGNGPFHAVIRSQLEPGHLDFADMIIPGETPEEVFLTTYVCHPSMANNELSGPVVLTALAQWLLRLHHRRYTYRLYWGPETIGAITYLHYFAEELRAQVRAGWVLTCMGDDRTYSFLPSRSGGTLADRSSLLALREAGVNFESYRFASRGSDERQWCWPSVDLPVCSLMRSKYGTYPEYHTSLDNLDFVSPSGLAGSLSLMTKVIEMVEENAFPTSTTLGEPQLGRRNLYPTLGTRHMSHNPGRNFLELLSLADGSRDFIEICSAMGSPFHEVVRDFRLLEQFGVVRLTPSKPTPD